MIGSKKLIVLLMVVAGLVAAYAAAEEYVDRTPISEVSIESLSDGDIVFAGGEYTVTSSGGSGDTDAEASCESIWYSDNTLVHTWSGNGSFSPTTGTSVTWTAPTATGTATITVTADDDGTTWFDDTATTDSIDLTVTNIIYVDLDKTSGNNDGTSWANAFLSLQDALAAADDAGVSANEIWVAEGTYFPDDGTDRTKSFELVDGIDVYGGFEGIAAEDERGDRDWFANETILSGDIDDDGSLLDGDNSYHVVKGADAAILDGFTITGGCADGTGNDIFGGGVFNYEVSPTISHCIIKDNYASIGGGMCNFGTGTTSADVDVINCLIIDNDALSGAGVACGAYSTNVFENCTISNNVATISGGGIYSSSSSCDTEIINSIVWGNTDSDDLNYEIVSNATDVEIIYSNYGNVAAVSSGTFTYTGINSSLEPRFVGSGDYHLKSKAGRWNGSTFVTTDAEAETSICIDGGDSTSDYSNEPSDDGDRINLGYYGNTAEASKYLQIFDVITFNYRVYVDGYYSGSHYGTESQPYPNIQAIRHVLNGGVVFVKKATYDGYSGGAILSFEDDDTGFSLVGIPDSSGNKPIIDPDVQAEFNVPVLYFDGVTNDFVIDGFILENGNPIRVGGYALQGGGVYINNCSPTIKNCVIRNNAIDIRNAAYGEGGQGGGMYIKDGDPIIFNCEFYGNFVYGWPGSPPPDYTTNKGGAIYTDDSLATFSYCTIGSTVEDDYNYSYGQGTGSNVSHEIYTAGTTVPTYDHCGILGGFDVTDDRMHDDGNAPDDGGGNYDLAE